MTASNCALSSFLKDVRMLKLDNGLSALFKRDDSSPLVSIEVWVGVGSINEDEKTRGLSHFLEHLIFKGSKKYPGDAISHLVETNGGVINAGTSKEYTVYYIDIQKDAFWQAADILADAMQNALLPADEIEKERPVIIEEIKRSEDSPEGTLYDIFFKAIFPTSVYRHRIIGDKEVIRNVTRDEIFSYYKKHYLPANMVVSVAGDLTEQEFENTIRSLFGAIPSGEKPQMPELKEMSRPVVSTVTQKKKVAHVYAAAGFLAPDLKNDHQFAAELAAVVLGEGRSSRLYKNLREKKQIVYSIGSSYYGQRGDGIFGISAVFDKKNLDIVRKEVEAEVAALATTGPTDEEMARARAIIKSQWIFQQEKIHDQASMLGYWQLQDNLKILDEYLHKINAVKKDDIIEFFKRYGDKGLIWAFVEPF